LAAQEMNFEGFLNLKIFVKILGSVDLFTKAILAQPFSSSLYAGRAYSVLQMRKPNAAIRDCEIALKLNPEEMLVWCFEK
jgi:hypothetical protein